MKQQILRFILVSIGVFLIVAYKAPDMVHSGDSPSYQMIISSNYQGGDLALYLASPDGTVLRQLTDMSGLEDVLEISDDGEWVIIWSSAEGDYYSIHIPTNQVQRIVENNDSVYKYLQPDNSVLFFALGLNSNREGGLHHIDLETGQEQWIADTDGPYNWAAVDPQQEWLYFQTTDIRNRTPPHISRYDLGSGHIEHLIDGDFGRLYGWSLDGNWLLVSQFVETTDTINLVRIASDGSTQQQVIGSSGDGRLLIPSPDGQWMIFQTYATPQAYRLDADGGNAQVVNSPSPAYFIGWSPDSEWMIMLEESRNTDDDIVRAVVKVHVKTGERNILWEPTRSTSAFMFADNTRLTVGRVENHQSVYYTIDVYTGKRQHLVQLERGSLVDWSPDGEWFYFWDYDDMDNLTLNRVRYDGTDQSVVYTAIGDNNDRPIFAGWITVQHD